MDVEIKSRSSRFFNWEYSWLCLILIATLAMHFSIINNTSAMLFDEEHYIRDARNIIQNHDTLRSEHPPLGKLLIVAGIRLFGDNPVGWRFFSVIFGTITILLFYLLCRNLGMSRTASSLATFILALENMTFVQASIAMLDVYYVTFMVAAFLVYFYRNYIGSGILVGLSSLAKIPGVLSLPVIVIHWFATRKYRSRWVIVTIVSAVISVPLLMPLFDYIISRHFVNPLNQIKNILSLTEGLTFASSPHGAMSRPWQWVLSYRHWDWPLPNVPVPHYIQAISPSVWVAIIPVFLYLLYLAIKRNEAGIFGSAWFFSTYLIWIPASLISNRISYIYYFYPSVGAICIGLGVGLSKLINIFNERPSGRLKWAALTVVLIFLLSHVALFVIMSPVSPVDLYGVFHITPKF
jgi:dolichyl-phosphate-mannose-protein mannosyltransferase